MCICVEHHTAAAKVNKSADFGELCVYGVLTSLTRFTFYSYDPISNAFYLDDTIIIGNKRDGFSSDMIHGTCLVS